MKTIAEIRLENLLLLIKEHDGIPSLNEKIGLARTDATLAQIKNQNANSGTGKPRNMGDALARRIETALSLEVGWMDNQQTPPSYRQDRIRQATIAMEKLPDWEFDQAIKVIVTLAEPKPKNGTSN